MSYSTYYFIGSISDKWRGYQVQDVKLADGVEFSLFLEGIVFKKTTQETFDILRNNIVNTAEIIISGVILQTHKPLLFSLQYWVEAKETRIAKDTVGWFGMPEVQLKNLKTQRSPINTPWKKSAKLYDLLMGANENHILALKDFKSAVNDNSHDSFLFAYRAIEDICRSITGQSPQESWEGMHSKLKTNKTYIDPLTKVAECVRHGDINNPLVKNANKKVMLEITSEIIEKELSMSFGFNY